MILNANALHIPLADQSVQCVITSPPYWGLRDYGTASWIGGDAECDHTGNYRTADSIGRANSTLGGGRGTNAENERSQAIYRDICGKCGAIRQDAQLGLEPTPEEYVANMVAVFREVWRVLRDDGTLWLNLGDSYAREGGKTADVPRHWDGRKSDPGGLHNLRSTAKEFNAKPKDLVGIPWRVAFALQADGWYLRSDIIWSKPNPMPESVTDRPTKAHEYVFLLTKQARYYYDAEAAREENSNQRLSECAVNWREHPNNGEWPSGTGERMGSVSSGRNRRTVWNIATQPYSGAHFATFPEALVEPCLLAGTSERGCCPVCGKAWRRVVEKGERIATSERGNYDWKSDAPNDGLVKDGAYQGKPGMAYENTTTGWLPACEHDAAPIPCTVFDPFAGSGTVGVVAQRFGRKFIGTELSIPYIKLAQERIAKANGYHVGRMF